MCVCYKPMSIFTEEHFMEGKLTIQVSFNHIDPALQSWLRVQSLEQKQEIIISKGYDEICPVRW